MSDELRDQIGRLDPMHPGVQIEPPSREHLEDIMDHTPNGTTQPARSRWYALTGVAAVALALAIAIPAFNADGPTTTTTGATTPLGLSLGDGGDAMASCMVFDVAVLAGMPVAFEGTVIAVDGTRVTMTVDRWFTGGDAAIVELTGAEGAPGLIGEVDFVTGSRYLVTATGGAVNYCGYTGPSTPELQAAFEQAFAG